MKTEVSLADSKWKTYTHTSNNYSIDYPDILDLSEAPYTSVFIYKQSSGSGPVFPFLYVSTIPQGFTNKDEVYNYMPPDTIDKIFTLKDNDTFQVESEADPEYWTFQRLASYPVSGITGVMIQNNNIYRGEGLKSRRVLVRNNGTTYIIGSYYSTQEELDAYRMFLESFKFTEEK